MKFKIVDAHEEVEPEIRISMSVESGHITIKANGFLVAYIGTDGKIHPSHIDLSSLEALGFQIDWDKGQVQAS